MEQQEFIRTIRTENDTTVCIGDVQIKTAWMTIPDTLALKQELEKVVVQKAKDVAWHYAGTPRGPHRYFISFVLNGIIGNTVTVTEESIQTMEHVREITAKIEKDYRAAALEGLVSGPLNVLITNIASLGN